MSDRPDASSRARGDASEDPRKAMSRRAFLGGVGAATVGAGAATAGVVRPVLGLGEAAPVDQTTNLINHRATTFGRLFPNLPPFAIPSDGLRDIMRDIGKPGGLMDAGDALDRGPVDLIVDPALSEGNPNNPTHTAGTHFIGQFIDHDITFDLTSRLGFPTEPSDSPNTRSPFLDLDSVYGGGPRSSPQLYRRSDRAKLRIESGGLFEDLPRDSENVAIIGDPRNDENLMIAGLHAAVILMHNNVVDRLRRLGFRSGVFSRARRIVTRHYQWIAVNQFLRQVIGSSRLESILRRRRFFRPTRMFIPVEFQVAYRMGHSMVRPSYRANLAGDPDGSADSGAPAFFGMIFDPAGEGQDDPVDLRGEARAPRRFIGWQTFFDFGDGEVRANKRLDTKISTPLFNLPLQTIPTFDPPTSLAVRNLLRHLTWELPSGQAVAHRMQEPILGPDNFDELRQYGIGLEHSTPLWYYVLREAEVMADGLTLGPVGGNLVGEVFIGALRLDPNSYLNQSGWRPFLPSRLGRGQFDMVDLLTFAGVDPASRGQ